MPRNERAIHLLSWPCSFSLGRDSISGHGAALKREAQIKRWTRAKKEALVYPDTFFIPIYFLTSYLLFKQHRLGKILGLIAGGAMVYALIYLLALSKLKGTINLFFDSLFLTINILAALQIIKLSDNKST